MSEKNEQKASSVIFNSMPGLISNKPLEKGYDIVLELLKNDKMDIEQAQKFLTFIYEREIYRNEQNINNAVNAFKSISISLETLADFIIKSNIPERFLNLLCAKNNADTNTSPVSKKDEKD